MAASGNRLTDRRKRRTVAASDLFESKSSDPFQMIVLGEGPQIIQDVSAKLTFKSLAKTFQA